MGAPLFLLGKFLPLVTHGRGLHIGRMNQEAV